MKNIKNTKGITLIALVITIILLLILAGVTLNLVLNGGLIEKSQTAVDKYSEEQAKERLLLDISEYKMGKITGEYSDFKQYIESIKDGTVEVDTENNKYKVTIYGYEFILDKETLEIEGGNKGEDQTPQQPQEPEQKTKYMVTISKGTGIESVTESKEVEEGQSLEITAKVASAYIFNKWEITSGTGTIENETSTTTKVTPTEDITIEALASITKIIANGNNINGTGHGTITGGEYAYNNPVIPVGFKISTAGASWDDTNNDGAIDGWNDGLIITDVETNGNEFVWVPVDKTDVNYGLYFDIGNLRERFTELELPSGTIKTEEAMVADYGGFYIARYEAGIPSNGNLASTSSRNESGIPVSKKNQIPWNNISWTKARENAESMYTLSNTNNHVQSVLVTEKMWDTVMQWLNSAEEEINVTTDSRGWGNYNNASVTGVTEYSTDAGVNWTKVTSTTKANGTSWLLKTGHSEYTNRKNIYDLSGNLWEWINSIKTNSSDYVIFGGGYISDGMLYVPTHRGYNDVSGANTMRFPCCLIFTIVSVIFKYVFINFKIENKICNLKFIIVCND